MVSALERVLDGVDEPGDQDSGEHTEQGPEAEDRGSQTGENGDLPHLALDHAEHGQKGKKPAGETEAREYEEIILHFLDGQVGVSVANYPILEVIIGPYGVRKGARIYERNEKEDRRRNGVNKKLESGNIIPRFSSIS